MADASDVRAKIVYTFNSVYFDLVKDIKSECHSLRPAIREHYRVASKTDERHIEGFALELSAADAEARLAASASLANVAELLASCKIVHDARVSDVLAAYEGAEGAFAEQLAGSLCILAGIVLVWRLLDADVAQADALLDKFLLGVRGDAEALDDIIDDDLRALATLAAGPAPSASAPSPSAAVDDLVSGTKLGKLAKEIADEIDVNALADMKSPEDIFKLGDKDSVFGKVISKAGAKIFEKMQAGELRQDELFGEMFSFMTALNGPGGKSPASGGSAAAMASQMLNNPAIRSMVASAMGGGKPPRGSRRSR